MSQMRLPLEFSTWRISAKWAIKRINCSAAARALRETGCCTGGPRRKYWPGKLGPDNRCPHLAITGCALPFEKRPVVCHLSPFRLRGDMLVLHAGSLAPRGKCRPCYDQGGPMIIEALAPNFAYLFGEDEYARVKLDLTTGRNALAHVPTWVLESLRREREMQERNECP